MLTAYIFCLVLGGGLLALSFFGDFLEGDVDAAIDLDADIDSGLDAGDFARLFSLRAIVYALFGFGAAGTVLYAIWGGARPGLTAALAGAMGLASGALINAVFGYLKRTESGTMQGEASLVGLRGEVRMTISEGEIGQVRIESGARQYRIRARADDLDGAALTLEAGRPVVVVDVREGVAVVAPVEMKLLED